jgi:hypothetical protein
LPAFYQTFSFALLIFSQQFPFTKISTQIIPNRIPKIERKKAYNAALLLQFGQFLVSYPPKEAFYP